MARQFRSVGVVGLGTMGAGIAEVFARSGIPVVGLEPDEEALARGLGHLRRSTDRAVSRGRMSGEHQEALIARVRLTTELADLADVDLVIEAVPELLELKRELFGRLDRTCAPTTVFATNTSSLSVTAIAAATSRPDRVLGMHFFNPAPVLGLVEVVHTLVTDPTVKGDVVALAERLGKSPVVVGDRAGFVANALLFGYLNQAVEMLQSGHASRQDIDLAMVAGGGLPLGPIHLLDLIGLDTSYEVLRRIADATHSRRHAPATLLQQLVTVGRLGRKSGHGFEAYGDGDGAEPPAPVRAAPVSVVGDERLSDRLRAAGVAVVADGAAVDLAVGGEPSGERRVGVRQVGGDSLVELVRGASTSPDAVTAARAAYAAIGVPAVVCSDRAGGIVDALLFPYLADSVRMAEDGYATPTEIDTAMTQGCGYREGPFAVLERIGAARAVEVLETLYAETREPHLTPPRSLRRQASGG